MNGSNRIASLAYKSAQFGMVRFAAADFSLVFVQVLGIGGAIVRDRGRGAVHGHLHGSQLRRHSSPDFLQYNLR